MRPEDRDREATCFRLLRELRRCEFVLIGGYAVSAYGPPRFSVDLDLVLPSSEVETVGEIVRKRGLSRAKAWDGGGVFAGRAERWTLGAAALPVSVDLLIGGVYDRISGAGHSYEEVRLDSAVHPLRGLDPESSADARVASREALLALKLEAGRKVDLRDVAILASGTVRLGRVEGLLAAADRTIVLEHLRALEVACSQPDFVQSLKSVYMLDERALRKNLEATRRLAGALLRPSGAHRDHE